MPRIQITYAPAPAAAVERVETDPHYSADTDSAPASLHHTLGSGPYQAAAGTHSHPNYALAEHVHSGPGLPPIKPIKPSPPGNSARGVDMTEQNQPQPDEDQPQPDDVEQPQTEEQRKAAQQKRERP